MPDRAVIEASIFGKLPAHGDFVARGLSGGERDHIDHWLSTSLTEARALYRDGFDARYDQAAPWRFLRQEEKGWVAGAVALSVDSAGRRFPLYAQCGGVDTDHRAAAVAVAVEELLYRAIAEAWTVDDATAALSRLDGDIPDDPWSRDDDALSEGWWSHDASGVALADRFPPELAVRMLAGAPE